VQFLAESNSRISWIQCLDHGPGLERTGESPKIDFH
jgi:hypothetical protein